MTKRRSPKKLEDLIQDDELRTLLKDESTRGKVLITGAHIDNLLTVLLKTWLFHPSQSKSAEDDLFDGDGSPLGSWANKTKFAYRLGLIDAELRSIIDSLRQIRNWFAHQIENANWKDEEVNRVIAKLACVRELLKEFTGNDSDNEKIFHSAAGLCIHFIKHTIGFCTALARLEKRPEVSSMVYTSIEDQIWQHREAKNIFNLMSNYNSTESNTELLKWVSSNSETIERVYRNKYIKKAALGVSDISLATLDIPLSNAEKLARKKLQEFMENIQDKPPTS